MEIGAAIFFTDYSMTPTELAVALEQRGFDSLWVAEHSHMPVTRRFTHPLGEAALTKEYFDAMDPFVALSAAAAVTKRLKLGTAICLVIQRDTIQTAKLVASLDQVSKARFLFGIGCGLNAEEMEDHGTVYETRTLKMREQIEAMKEIWTKDTAEYHGQIVDFPPMQVWPKPVQQVLRCRRVGRPADKGRECSDVSHIVAERVLLEAAHGHVFDHARPQWADGPR